MLGTLASLGSSAISYLGTQKTNESNEAMSGAQMNFQKMMSNTAHRREVRDLRKAGLNPILSAKYGGASTPPGAMATMQNELGSAVNTYQATKTANINRKNIEQDTDLKDKQAGLAAENIEVAKQTARKEAANANAVEFNNVRAAIEAKIFDSAVGEGTVAAQMLKGLGLKIPVRKKTKLTPNDGAKNAKNSSSSTRNPWQRYRDSKKNGKITNKDIKAAEKRMKSHRGSNQTHDEAFPWLYNKGN